MHSCPPPHPPPRQLKAAREGKLRRARRKRQVDYDKWRAVNHLEAERLLKEGGRVGDWVFRPSGTGTCVDAWLRGCALGAGRRYVCAHAHVALMSVPIPIPTLPLIPLQQAGCRCRGSSWRRR